MTKGVVPVLLFPPVHERKTKNESEGSESKRPEELMLLSHAGLFSFYTDLHSGHVLTTKYSYISLNLSPNIIIGNIVIMYFPKL